MAEITAAQVKQVVSVASGIIYSQEGNYGTVNKNDNEHGMSIGKCQWNADAGRALSLLQTIVKANDAQAKKILGASLYKEITESKSSAWNNQGRAATAEEAKAISALLTSKEGKEAQDNLAEKDITRYINNGVKNGVVSLKALAYYADLENQGGASASKRIATAAGKALGGMEKVGLKEIHEYALKDTGKLSQYPKRRNSVYEAVKSSNLSDNAEVGENTDKEENAKNEPQEKPQTANKEVQTLSKGDIVTFTGGLVYVSSAAPKAAKEKNVVSTCKVTVVNAAGKHPYHLVSTDGKSIYGWVDAEDIKELATNEQKEPGSVAKGDIVTFTGGPVYVSSTASNVAKEKNVVSTCKVTAVNAAGKHPYHLVSTDGKGIYGWVDAKNVK